VYADDLASGPITVLWKGAVDVVSLQQFVAVAAHKVSPHDQVRYRTRITTHSDRDVVESLEAPQLGRLAAEAQFVRFECAPVTGSNPAQDSEADPTLIAWAVIDEPGEDKQESIGIYFRRENLSALLPQIESLLMDTAVSKSFPRDPRFRPTRSEQTKHALRALNQDLG
jgi:hypothetical protein